MTKKLSADLERDKGHGTRDRKIGRARLLPSKNGSEWRVTNSEQFFSGGQCSHTAKKTALNNCNQNSALRTKHRTSHPALTLKSGSPIGLPFQTSSRLPYQSIQYTIMLSGNPCTIPPIEGSPGSISMSRKDVAYWEFPPQARCHRAISSKVVGIYHLPSAPTED